ncbi:TetR/AcrR family transcriptional regulator [Amycolatopsis pithecellobii]|uniref:TetR family transcriptional regulator n=1 Tax=Amycolatopsis pithecellobii TaxID=664692 RepID=A0A6N7YNC2_9PSEU|nr:TetR/AcrR family transcriptional regulator [Amycolatopsis pithecellobii]MTD54475.1 TetR family transcriptional regulator [Amycolatopsis pithecellobii]
MSGRKQFDVDEALDKAMRQFWEHGFAETSIDTLGKAMGLGRGSLYGTFGDKDALFRQALVRYSASYEHRYDLALAEHPDDPVAAIEAFFGVILDRIADPDVPGGCLVIQSAAQGSALSPEARDAVRGALTAQRRRVRRALEPASATVDASVLDDLALLVTGVQQAIVVQSRSAASPEELRSLARTAVDAVATALDKAH